jgi:hypothetical protein
MKRIFKREVSLGVVVGMLFCFVTLSHAEPYLYQIYNNLYGTGLTSDAQLLATYGKACSDTGDPCTQDADCTAGTCVPIDDQVFFLETDGYLRATARYAGYTQLFGYYSDPCIGSGSNYTWYPLFNVTDSDYLYRCSVTNTPCIDTNDCPAGQTCQSVSGKDYDEYILMMGVQTLIGFFDDPSGSPVWYSQNLLNSDGANHMKTFRAADYDRQTNPEYLIGWEDLPASSWDADYQDLVVIIKFFEPQSITCCNTNADCADGLYCNGAETCVNNVCQGESSPCPDDGMFCNGTEGCDENTDQCTHSGDPCTPPTICEESINACVDCITDADCADGLYCNGVETCVNNVCQGGSNPCPDDGVFCNGTEGCDENTDQCTHSGDPCTPPAICAESLDACVDCITDADCADGLYCNGVETCVNNVCQGGSSPCPDDGVFCNGTEGCDENTDQCTHSGDPCPDDGVFCNGAESCNEAGNVCDHSGDPCVPDLLCDEEGNACYEVTIDVGDGSGAPGSVHNPVSVSLDNTAREVEAIQIDICDVDNYLTCTSCEATGRASQLNCVAGEQLNGCCRIVVYSLNPTEVIAPGTGPVFTVRYDAAQGAPVGGCRDLNPQNVIVMSTLGTTIPAKAVQGEFCFNPCTSGLDCDDSDICTTDTCNGGVCQYTNNTAPCDDGDPCTRNDVCVEGTCAGTPIPGCPCGVEIALGRECPGEEIDDPAYNRPGRRGLAATCGDVIDFTVCSDCIPFNPDCLIWEIDPNLAGSTITQIDDCCWRMTVGDICESLEKIVTSVVTVTDTCNSGSDSVEIEIGKVIVDLGEATIQPNSESATVDINLINPNHAVRAFTMDVAACTADEDNLVCTQCLVDPDRALAFTCSASERADGICRVVMYATNPSAIITQGRGPVARIVYAAGPELEGLCGADACIDLCPINIQMSDQFNERLCTCESPGEVCFRTCGDIYPQDCIGGTCGAPTCCGDGVIDLFDILEAVDIILNLQTATACQLGNGDVPNGMPPYCGNPSGTPNCESDGDIDILDVLVIIDKALGKMNCCDYCLFGQIY